jgi:hypothetical protein
VSREDSNLRLSRRSVLVAMSAGLMRKPNRDDPAEQTIQQFSAGVCVLNPG